jgi:hypothetical protein
MTVIRPTGGFGTDRAIVPGAAYKFVANLDALPLRADPGVSPQIIYRIYFAMPKIPEIASQHKLCIAKKVQNRSQIQVGRLGALRGSVPQDGLDRANATSSLNSGLRDRHGPRSGAT